MTHRILLVEDDRKLAPLVRNFLEDHHFEVAWASDGDQGWHEFERSGPDLVILDLMLPGRDGLTLCRQIRAASRTGILILTAKGDETDRVVGLELGADDYLTKPFSLPELLARIRAVLRRLRPAVEEEPVAVRTVGPFTIDLGAIITDERTCQVIADGPVWATGSVFARPRFRYGTACRLPDELDSHRTG